MCSNPAAIPDHNETNTPKIALLSLSVILYIALFVITNARVSNILMLWVADMENMSTTLFPVGKVNPVVPSLSCLI